MSHKSTIGRLAFLSLMSFSLSGCFHPPFNNFKPYNRTYMPAATGAAVGSAAVAVVSGPILAGTAIGGGTGAVISLYKDSKHAIINDLPKYDIQYIAYGDTITLVVPTDRYFQFNSARLNDICYPGLVKLIKLIKFYPGCCPIYVAAFTDDIGSRYHKRRLSQARAETMLTFLWANGIPAQRLVAEGYSDKHPVGDNKLIHGSAHNRRLEIQILNACPPPSPVGYK